VGSVSADPVRLAAVAAACSRRLSGHRLSVPARDLAELAEEAARGGEADRYGDGGLVTELEEAVRALLGTEAAVVMPSGTLAQQAALRVHADARGRSRVAMHPSAHPLTKEEDALVHLQGLDPVAVGDPWSLPTVDELLAPDGLAAVLVELPQRSTGGQLMAWDDLVELSQRCRAAGVALHLDGARLWECGPAYRRPYAEVAALVDSTYVSLYKGLGALAGAVLAGPADLVSAARTWRQRAGGTLPSLWPLALGARRGLREQLPLIGSYVTRAQELAAAVAAAGLAVACEPRTPLLHVLLPGDRDRLLDALLDVAERSGVFLGGGLWDTRDPDVWGLEVSVGAATDVGADEAVRLLQDVVRTAARD
jgi:threonine aldolase